jgi:hypothetical protein
MSTLNRVPKQPPGRKKTSSDDLTDVRGVNCWKLGRPIRLGHQIDYWLISSAHLTIVGGRSMKSHFSTSCANQEKSLERQPDLGEPAVWDDFAIIRWIFTVRLLVFRRRTPDLLI